MLIKLFGAVAVLFSCIFCGIKKSKELLKREKSLKSIKTALNMLESEIAYSSNYLKNAFLNLSKISDCKNLFLDVAKGLDEENAKRAWDRAIEKNKKSLFLKDSDVEVLKVLSSQLGMSDTEQQIKNIKHTMSLLDMAIASADEEYKNSAKLYRSMGILTGLFFVILLL